MPAASSTITADATGDIVIEKPILQLLRIERDTCLELTTDGDCIVLRPIRESAPMQPDELLRGASKKDARAQSGIRENRPTRKASVR